jgi:RNA polymerase sigma-70 factor (ECF subfamily)
MMSPAAIGNADWMEFEARLRRFVRGRVDPLWADDVVGGILLRLVEHRDALEGARNPIAYVLRVATNAVTDHYRRRSVERRALAEVGQEADPAVDPQGGEPQDAQEEIARCFEGFIRALPDVYRDALELTELDGLSQVEAAQRLGLSHSGLKSRVQRGRAQLKRVVLRCCAIEIDRRGSVIALERRGRGCDAAC